MVVALLLNAPVYLQVETGSRCTIFSKYLQLSCPTGSWYTFCSLIFAVYRRRTSSSSRSSLFDVIPNTPIQEKQCRTSMIPKAYVILHLHVLGDHCPWVSNFNVPVQTNMLVKMLKFDIGALKMRSQSLDRLLPWV